MSQRQQVVWGSTVFACVCLLLAAVANAQPPKQKPKPGRPGEGQGRGGMPSAEQIFQRFDANSDGKLTKDELPQQAADRIMRADTNGDGAVTKEELEEVRKRLGGGQRGGGRGMPNPEELFKRLDANGDGKLSKDELPERFGQRIMQADANKDGTVTKEEFAEVAKRMGGGRGGPGGQPDPAQLFARADKNGDGKLTKDELPGPLAERLMKADADGDGAVTKAELEEARKKAGGRPRPDAGGRGGFDPAQMFKRLDRNGDGKVGLDELPERMAERLKGADTDGDGAISKEEFEQARKNLGGRGGRKPKPSDP